MHTNGNDFIVINALSSKVTLAAEQIASLADRHKGIGFDQLLLLQPPDQPDVDFGYRIYNADGSKARQCGNGALCLARFIWDQQLSVKLKITIHTDSGIIVTEADGAYVRVSMPAPRLNASELPIDLQPRQGSGQSIRYPIPLEFVAAGRPLEFSILSVGNLHAVLNVADISLAPVDSVGKALQQHTALAEQANVGFMQPVDRRQIKLRVYERGAQETLACGSGACAAVVAGIYNGILDEVTDDDYIMVRLPGGDLEVQWSLQKNALLLLRGKPCTVYSGYL